MQISKLGAALAATVLACGLSTPLATAASSGSSSSSAFALSSKVISAAMSTGSTTRTALAMDVPNQGQRSFILHVPESYDPTVSYPVVFGFGGMDNTDAFTESYMKMEKTTGDDAIVVYPQQRSTGAHAGWEGPLYGPARGDDVAFVKQILGYLKSTYNVNQYRVYAAGLSNGGGMALSLACQAPDTFAAVVGVATASYTPIFNGCGGQVPTLMIHGTEDPIAPYNSDGANAHGGSYYSARHAWRLVGERNGCRVDSLSRSTAGNVDKFSMNGCLADTELYRVNGGGHTWFPNNPSATKEAWNFLQRHTR